jgi:hypothetical protein
MHLNITLDTVHCRVSVTCLLKSNLKLGETLYCLGPHCGKELANFQCEMLDDLIKIGSQEGGYMKQGAVAFDRISHFTTDQRNRI